MNPIILSSRTGWSARQLSRLVRLHKVMYTPAKLSTQEWLDLLKESSQLEDPVLVSVGYMYRIPGIVLKVLPAVNLHPGKLPELAGKDPHIQALRLGLKVTAVTLHHVTDEIDGGPIISEVPVNILPNDTPESLEQRLKVAGVLLLASWLAGAEVEVMHGLPELYATRQ